MLLDDIFGEGLAGVRVRQVYDRLAEIQIYQGVAFTGEFFDQPDDQVFIADRHLVCSVLEIFDALQHLLLALLEKGAELDAHQRNEIVKARVHEPRIEFVVLERLRYFCQE